MYTDCFLGRLWLGRRECSFSFLVLLLQVNFEDGGFFLFFEGRTEVNGGDCRDSIVF